MAHTNSRILCIWQRKWNSTVCLNGKWYPDILLNLKIKQDDQALYLRFAILLFSTWIRKQRKQFQILFF